MLKPVLFPRTTSNVHYGTLNCIGFNKVGRQLAPCTFNLSPASRPFSPKNCTIFKGRNGHAEVRCAPNFNGGLKQTYYLEV